MANVLNYSLEAAARTRRSPDVRVVAARKDDAPAILLPSENVVSASRPGGSDMMSATLRRAAAG